jgi:hypothetical protein
MSASRDPVWLTRPSLEHGDALAERQGFSGLWVT